MCKSKDPYPRKKQKEKKEIGLANYALVEIHTLNVIVAVSPGWNCSSGVVIP
jgi:hypothetical protein